MRLRLPSLAEFTVLTLIATLIVATLALARQEKHARDMALETSIDDAALLIAFQHAAHAQYSASIRGVEASGVEHTAEDVPAVGAIHFPGTFSRHLSKNLSDTLVHTRFRIYSDDPFYVTEPQQLDSFERDALAALLPGDRAVFWRIETTPEGVEKLRYASPVRMESHCVACHNRLEWGLNKSDWKPGDVRGVREVSLTLPETAFHSTPERAMMITLVFLCTILGLCVVYPMVRFEVARRTHFESLSLDLFELSETDALSGLANRRAFERILGTVLERPDAAGRVGLIILDIDHFKTINDTHGHDTGDGVIRHLGQVMEGALRKGDMAARIGGEEFAVICPDVSAEDLSEIAERLRHDIQTTQFPGSDAAFKVTTSIGAALFASGETATGFFQRTDQLLLQAKEMGRNRVCFSEAA